MEPPVDIQTLIEWHYESGVITEEEFYSTCGELNLFWPNIRRAANALSIKIKLTLGALR